MRTTLGALLVGLVLLASGVSLARAEVRIKDITDLEGARPNQLLGFGLVVGLDNTGGRSTFTLQTAAHMLTRFNTVPRINSTNQADAIFRAGTISVVMVTAELGPWARRGSRVDVVISAVDDATSLQGGTLIFTPLRGADGVDYAVAQGPLSLGGFIFTAPVGNGQQPLATVQKNHPTVGRIPGGAIVEREARAEILCEGRVHLLLKEPDFTTANRIGRAINTYYPNSTIVQDAGAIDVRVPKELSNRLVEFLADVGQLEVAPDVPARIVINERTGTIVAGQNVKIASIAIAHGNLSITTDQQLFASQPAPFSGGTTEVLPQASVRVNEQAGSVRVLPKTVTVGELASALNSLGATPRDLITIFQAIKQAGALYAELILI